MEFFIDRKEWEEVSARLDTLEDVSFYAADVKVIYILFAFTLLWCFFLRLLEFDYNFVLFTFCGCNVALLLDRCLLCVI